MVEQNDNPDAEAILVPDTALHTVAWLEQLEAAAGKPVLTANQVTFWKRSVWPDVSNPRLNLERFSAARQPLVTGSPRTDLTRACKSPSFVSSYQPSSARVHNRF
jgi:hypothetical protein